VLLGQSVCDVALSIQESNAAPGISLASEQVESLRGELAEASQRERDLQARQEEDAAELQRLRDQLAAAEEKARVLAEEATSAQAKVGELEAVASAVVETQPAAAAAAEAAPAEEEWLETITNDEARAWWKAYIGQRAATYNAVQDATTAWMLKVDTAMTQAEASIVAATGEPPLCLSLSLSVSLSAAVALSLSSHRAAYSVLWDRSRRRRRDHLRRIRQVL
jgi:hypothetical protein